MTKGRLLASAVSFVLAMGAAGFVQAQQASEGAAAKPAETPKHPLGGYLPAPVGSTFLKEKVYQDAKGYPLYVLNRECFGQCAVQFPPLAAPNDAKPPSKDWRVRIRPENGELQWVYKGHPVYTFFDDRPDEPPKADRIIPDVALARP
jgi:predicted lipoprotein with Yx(FWY)xxD motif